MPAAPLRTDLANTYPAPSNALFKTGVGALWDFVTDLLGITGTKQAALDALRLLDPDGIYNLSLVPTVGASALTMNVKTRANLAPSATDPVMVSQRNATAGAGDFNLRTITGALALVFSSGSTLGHTSAVQGAIYWYLLDNGGAQELAASTSFFGTSGIVTTTAEGGAGAADSAIVMYSATARANVPFRCIARSLDTQTTAGVWAAVPTLQQVGVFDLPPQSQLNIAASVAGSVDAITATFRPAFPVLADKLRATVRAAGANATTTPTFAPDGLTAKIIVKQNLAALVAGDIVGAGHELDLLYNITADKWVLLNPGSVVAAIVAPAGGAATRSTVASATTPNIWTGTNYTIDYTGTVTSTGFAAAPQAGAQRLLIAAGASLLTHGANFILPGSANYTTAAGDKILVDAITTTQFRLTIWKADGTAVVAPPAAGITLGTPVASTSGTSITFTGFPAGTKRITVMFKGVSTNGASEWQIQLGDAGGFETTGYLGTSFGSTGVSGTTLCTTGFGIRSTEAAAVVHGSVILSLEDASDFTWSAQGVLGGSYSGTAYMTGGSKALSAELTQVRITTVNGTDAFDAGELNISYE